MFVQKVGIPSRPQSAVLFASLIKPLLLWSASTHANVLLGFILVNAFKPQTRPANNLPTQFSRKKKKRTFQKQLHCVPDEILMIRFGYKQEKWTVEMKKEKEVKLRLFQEDVWLFQGRLYSYLQLPEVNRVTSWTQERVGT